MKRILYLSRGGCIGGSQRQLYYVVSNLDHGYEPVVVCSEDGPFVGQLRASGVPAMILPLHAWRKFPDAMCRYTDAERLVRFARRLQISLVHSSDLWLSGYLIWAARRLKIPSVLHVRTPVSEERVRKHRCNKATQLVAISQRVRRNLISAGVEPEKISLIDDAVDLAVFSADRPQVNVLRRDFDPHGQILVGIVGRVKPSKHQLEFLQAAGQVVAGSSKQVTFFVIGEIHSRAYFRKLRRLITEKGLQGHVVFTGSRDDMPDVLRSLDVLVSLSGGSVMFEGMACGKCVISAGFSSKADSVHIQDGRTGVLLESRQPADLARTLLGLIEDTDVREGIGHRAREWAQENLSRDKMVAKTRQLYDQLMKG